MTTIKITIEETCPNRDDIVKMFTYGISQVMQDIQASEPEAFRHIDIEAPLPPVETLPPFGLVIFPNGITTPILVEAPNEKIQEVVGGYFEVIPNGHGMTIFANEDGLRLGLMPNRNASLLCERTIVGPIVCFGRPDTEGEVTPLTDEQIALIERF